jgi:hypothetical protein
MTLDPLGHLGMTLLVPLMAMYQIQTPLMVVINPLMYIYLS